MEDLTLREFINQVKKELFTIDWHNEEDVPVFGLEEVEVEVSFSVSSRAGGGFDLKVLKADADLTETTIQKATIKLKPLINPEKLFEELKTENPELLEKVFARSSRVALKGNSQRENRAPER